MSETLAQVREHVRARRVRVSQHAITELLDDGISLEAAIATLITAYRPVPERWMDDLMTRRPR
jgi:hypothetical protein